MIAGCIINNNNNIRPCTMHSSRFQIHKWSHILQINLWSRYVERGARARVLACSHIRDEFMIKYEYCVLCAIDYMCKHDIYSWRSRNPLRNTLLVAGFFFQHCYRNPATIICYIMAADHIGNSSSAGYKSQIPFRMCVNQKPNAIDQTVTIFIYIYICELCTL